MNETMIGTCTAIHEYESCAGSCSTQGNGGYTRNRGGNVEHQVGYNRTPTHFLI